MVWADSGCEALEVLASYDGGGSSWEGMLKVRIFILRSNALVGKFRVVRKC